MLRGTSKRLIDRLNEELVVGSDAPPQMASLHAADLQILTEFYERGPLRVRRLKRQFGLKQTMIDRELLDDLLALRSAGVSEIPPP